MMKRKWLVALALILIGVSGVKPTMAYFTDTVTTEGKLELKIGDGNLLPMEDTVENMIKKISISNTGEYSVLVRAKAIYPDSCTVTFENSTNWQEGADGYYYFNNILGPNEKTDQLNLKITSTATGGFNVIIIQEATKVIYNEDGSYTGDWDAAISSQTNTTP